MVPKWLWFLVEVAVKASGDLATLSVSVSDPDPHKDVPPGGKKA